MHWRRTHEANIQARNSFLHGICPDATGKEQRRDVGGNYGKQRRLGHRRWRSAAQWRVLERPRITLVCPAAFLNRLLRGGGLHASSAHGIVGLHVVSAG